MKKMTGYHYTAHTKGLSKNPGGMERPNSSTAHNSGKSGTTDFWGSNNKAPHKMSKLRSESSVSKKK